MSIFPRLEPDDEFVPMPPGTYEPQEEQIEHDQVAGLNPPGRSHSIDIRLPLRDETVVGRFTEHMRMRDVAGRTYTVRAGSEFVSKIHEVLLLRFVPENNSFLFLVHFGDLGQKTWIYTRNPAAPSVTWEILGAQSST